MYKSKRAVCFVLAVLLLGGLFGTVSFADSITLITNTAELNAIRNDLNGHYELTQDIVFTAADFEPGGAFYNNAEGFLPIAADSETVYFTGELDGNGYSVKGLQMNYLCNDESKFAFGGLFGRTKGYIHDVKLEDVQLAMQVDSQDHLIMQECSLGGIAGVNMGRIERCSVSGSVTCTVTAPIKINVGGIAGYNGSIIQNCYNVASVSGISNSENIISAGGIAGYASHNNEYTFSELL